MIRLLFSTSLLILLSLISIAQTDPIQGSIVYRSCSNSENQTAEALLKGELNKNCQYNLFNKYLYIGPRMWEYLSSKTCCKGIKGGDIQLIVPLSDKSTTVKKGKLIQNHEDFVLIWKELIQLVNKNSFIVRKPNSSELNYYWTIINFDIEEPIFVIENTNHKILIDLGKGNKILWIELI